MTTEEVQKIIDDVDENGDGRLDYYEVSFFLVISSLDYQRACMLKCFSKL